MLNSCSPLRNFLLLSILASNVHGCSTGSGVPCFLFLVVVVVRFVKLCIEKHLQNELC